MAKGCEHCGGPLPAGATCRRRFCCRACKQRARGQRFARRYRVECRRCGVVFFAGKRHAAYCSPRCRAVAYLERKRRRRGVPADRQEKTCPTCGLRFVTRRAHGLYCSRQCGWYVMGQRRIEKRRKTGRRLFPSAALVLRRAVAVRQQRSAKTAAWSIRRSMGKIEGLP